MRITLLILGVVNLLAVFALSIISCLFFIENNYDENDYLSRENTSMEWVLLLKKLSLIAATMPIKYSGYSNISVRGMLTLAGDPILHPVHGGLRLPLLLLFLHVRHP